MPPILVQVVMLFQMDALVILSTLLQLPWLQIGCTPEVAGYKKGPSIEESEDQWWWVIKSPYSVCLACTCIRIRK